MFVSVLRLMRLPLHIDPLFLQNTLLRFLLSVRNGYEWIRVPLLILLKKWASSPQALIGVISIVHGPLRSYISRSRQESLRILADHQLLVQRINGDRQLQFRPRSFVACARLCPRAVGLVHLSVNIGVLNI